MITIRNQKGINICINCSYKMIDLNDVSCYVISLDNQELHLCINCLERLNKKLEEVIDDK